MQNNVKNIWLITLGTILWAKGVTQTQEQFTKSLVGDQIAVDSNLTVKDDKFNIPTAWATIDKNIYVRDVVIFEINDDTDYVQTNPFTCDISLKIDKYDSTNTDVATYYKTLSVTFDTGGVKQYNTKDVFAFDWGYKIKVKILGITYTETGWGGVLPPVFRVRGEIYVDRKYKFDCSDRPAAGATTSATLGSIQVVWGAVDGAEEYDLEWTFYHDSSDVVRRYLESPSTSYNNYDSLFKNNATRVTIAQNDYYIPMIFPKGYVFYRVRGVQYAIDGKRKVTEWTAQDTTSTFSGFKEKVLVAPSDSTINWQYKAQFAEDGKRLPVVSYYDGTLRNRQTVAKSEAASRLLVGETFYDHQGRPVVQTLPVPTDDTHAKIQFNKDFTLYDGDPFTREQFDTGGCSFIYPALDSSSGAAKYYSKNNPDWNKAITRYLPRAEGYPYTATEYTPDLTGRVARQGNAGPALSIGQGHETKYYYGKPAQEELDRLFGNEAGYAEHYLKNMVLDPNGSISVAYVDASGKTIATALAGDAPDNLNALDENTGDSILLVNLLTDNSIEDNAWVENYSVTTSSAGEHTFIYSYLPAEYSNECLPEGMCFQCLYNLDIEVTDCCDNSNMPGDTAFTYALQNFTYGDIFDTVCEGEELSTLTHTFTLDLPVGEYHVKKTLSVSDAGKDQFIDAFDRNNTCILSYNDFLDSALANIDFSGCYMDCEECMDELGDSATFVSGVLDDLEDQGITPTPADTVSAANLYFSSLEECNMLCGDTPNECESLYNILKSDVYPGGQYATYSVDPDSYIYSAPDNSVLHIGSDDFGGKDYSKLTYTDSYGNLDTVWIDGVGYPPNQLPIGEFVGNFRDSWADTLVTLHPEYCYYVWCDTNPEVYEYESEMLSTNSYSEAVTNGYLNPLNIASLSTGLGSPDYSYSTTTNPDPFFKSGGVGHSYKPNMRDSMQQIGDATTYFTFWQLASLAANCPDLSCDPVPLFDDSCDANADLAWQIFRGLYLSKRLYYVDQVRTTETCDNSDIGVSGDFADMVPRVIHYTDATDLLADATTESEITSDAEDSIVSSCHTACESMTTAWVSALADCEWMDDEETVDDVEDGLVEVCEAGCNAHHPYGASTTPPGVTTASGYTSFEDVLYDVAGISDDDTTCNAVTIGFPYPYSDSTYNLGTQFFYGSRDTCVCETLATLYSSYQIDSTDETYTGSFTEYLADNYGSDLSEDQVETLMDVCTGDCSWAEPPIPLPESMSCSPCKTCHDVGYWYNQFVHYQWTTSPDFTNYQTYLADYLNLQLGFNLSYSDYATFIDSCLHMPGFVDTAGTWCGTILYFECPGDTADTTIFLCNTPIFQPVEIDTSDCHDFLLDVAISNATLAYNTYIDSVNNSFWSEYKSQCLASLSETFTDSMPYNEYHYTLYYYDQAGNLVKTVPPAGVVPLSTSSALDSVADFRSGDIGTAKYPSHTLITRYYYNTYNQLVKQVTPDADTTRFWYDRLGRIVASQNARQRPDDLYSYSIYDPLSRVIEAGQFEQTTPITFAIAADNASLVTWFGDATDKTQVVRIYYDDAALPVDSYFGDAGQENLRNRIASISWEKTDDDDSLTYDFATHYSYDVAGNVKTLIQEIGPLRQYGQAFKRIDYDYDLVSGKVNKVYYQKDSLDQFIHWYFYDEDNRLETVETSHDGILWDQDANYYYYKHGPLGRTELGSRDVQGLDYAFTLQGWLKGINGDFLDPNDDMGYDGKSGASHASFGTDVLAFTLSYFAGDYSSICGSAVSATKYTTGGFGAASPSLYNGNIRNASYSLKKMDDKEIGYAYGYDQLNRLVSMQAWTNFDSTNYKWPSSGSAKNKWKESITYDPNGNIETLLRHGYSPVAMDSLTYNYNTGTNQLNHVDDNPSYSSNYPNDIDDQSTDNYQYDATGNLSRDISEQISEIDWTLTNTVDSIGRTGASTKDELKFYYDAMGNRVGKIVYPNSGDTTKTWYIRDAQGNIMAIYEEINDTITWGEQDLYGSSRLGYWQPSLQVFPYSPPTPTDTFRFEIAAGQKLYEIGNHLGNVMAVITDRKIGYDLDADGHADYFDADLAIAQDFYPFGMVVPGRNWTTSSTRNYRFGFNGKENDDETYGNNNELDFGARIYDPRLGKWLSVDPSFRKYPALTPYLFSNDNPIYLKDRDGRDPIEGGQELSVTVSFFAYNFLGTDMPGPWHAAEIYDYSMYRKFDLWTLATVIPDNLLPKPPTGLMDVLKDYAIDLGTADLERHIEDLVKSTFSNSYSLDDFEYAAGHDPNNTDDKPTILVHRLVSNVGPGFESMVTYKEVYNLTYTKNKKGGYDVTSTISQVSYWSGPELNKDYGKDGTEFKDFKYIQHQTTDYYSADGSTIVSTENKYVGVNPRDNTKKCSICD